MLTEEERRTLSDVAAAGGVELDDAAWDLLASPAALVPTIEDATLLESRQDLAMRMMARRERWDAIQLGLTRGVYHLAARGYEFIPLQEAEYQRGARLAKLYRRASVPFRLFATTYSTLGAWNAARAADDADKQLMGLRALHEIELDLQTLFFPTADDDTTDLAHRERAQRQILAYHDTPIDVEDFMRGNSVLIRARREQTPGLVGAITSFFGRFSRRGA